MATIYHIDASARKTDSITRELSRQLANQLGGAVTYRDISQGLPLLTETMIGGYFTPAEKRSSEQTQAIAISDELVNELLAHDTFVIGVPIYNFSMPAAFKTWCDLIARVGVTFKYTDTGPVGLLEGKKAFIVTASGGTKINSDIDFFTPWLLHFFGFIGIKDVTIIGADALGRDAEAAIKKAKETIQAIQ